MENKVKRITKHRVYVDKVYYEFDNEEDAEDYADARGNDNLEVKKVTFYRAYRYSKKKPIAGLLDVKDPKKRARPEDAYNVKTYDFKTKAEAEACIAPKRYNPFKATQAKQPTKGQIKVGINDEGA